MHKMQTIYTYRHTLFILWRKRHTMLTREEADNRLLKAVVDRYPTTYDGADVIQILLEVFNDKEELEIQMKAKDEEIERLKEIIKALNEQIEDYEQFSETIASARG